MDYTAKYLHFKYQGKDPFEIVNEIMLERKMPLYAITKIREVFPFLSLTEAKEIVVIATSEHKSLYDYQRALFSESEKMDDVMNKEED